ncbi:Dol-P-Man:Man(5)GlcNAc(2)-PP-Dol alpha-1,3-mannosyltransferase [Fusarium oxysporum f. sp. albedinis]|nr:Dol-P-Man:Man(5)GlcNAc(2)-PP-Dol alpha-1,3-mannosyltransferase [Fusarium oxysporum f. sp. albedinis]
MICRHSRVAGISIYARFKAAWSSAQCKTHVMLSEVDISCSAVSWFQSVFPAHTRDCHLFCSCSINRTFANAPESLSSQ